MNPSSFSLKAIVIVHFILTVWASMAAGFLPTSYIYMNLFILIIGILSILHHESVDTVFLFLVLHGFSILQDIIFLGIYEPRGRAYFEKPETPAVLLYRIWQDRQGNTFEMPFTIPGMGNQNEGKYENIDHPVPSNSYIETASAPRGIDDRDVIP